MTDFDREGSPSELAEVIHLHPELTEQAEVADELGNRIYKGLEILGAMQRYGPPDVSRAATEALIRISTLMDDSDASA